MMYDKRTTLECLSAAPNPDLAEMIKKYGHGPIGKRAAVKKIDRATAQRRADGAYRVRAD